MKRLFISIPILACIAFATCKKASGPVNGNSVQLNNDLDSTVSVSATVNGSKWQTDSAFGYVVKSSGNDSTATGLMITANRMINGSSTTIVFNIAHYTGPDTYTINPPGNQAIYYVGTIRHFATSGTLIVTAGGSPYALTGTFSFVADSFYVENGIYDVAKP